MLNISISPEANLRPQDADVTAALRVAISGYQYTTERGDIIVCPVVLNNTPFLPDPENGVLSRPGAGKVSPAGFQTATEYALSVNHPRARPDTTLAEATRMRLVDGSLPDDNFNYTGIDCSGLVISALFHGLNVKGEDLFDRQIPYTDSHEGYEVPGWSPAKDSKNIASAQARQAALAEGRFNEEILADFDMQRIVDNSRVVEPVDIKAGDIRAGDIAIYPPGDPATDVAQFGHCAIVLGTQGRTRVKFAHSGGRKDIRTDIGGVQTLALTRERLLEKVSHPTERGGMTVRRLNLLDT